MNKPIRDLIADVFAAHAWAIVPGSADIDILVDRLTDEIEDRISDERDEARTEGMIAEREVHFG